MSHWIWQHYAFFFVVDTRARQIREWFPRRTFPGSVILMSKAGTYRVAHLMAPSLLSNIRINRDLLILLLHQLLRKTVVTCQKFTEYSFSRSHFHWISSTLNLYLFYTCRLILPTCQAAIRYQC